MGQKEVLEEIVTNSDLTFVGMKVLAAGAVKPQVAFDYIAKFPIKAVTVGMVTKEEIQETVPIALKTLQT